MIRKLINHLIARLLIWRGSRLMARYMEACEIASTPWLAEQVMPKLRHIRREARKCAKFAMIYRRAA